MAYRKILAAVEDSPTGAHVLRSASTIASAAHAELIALRLVDDPWPFIEPGEVEAKRAMRDSSWQHVATARVTDQLNELSESEGIGSVDVTTAVRFGLPRTEIAHAAEIDQVDLVVLGRSPAGPPEPAPQTWALDGTLRRAHVPCLIVPPGPRAWRRIVVLGDGGIRMGEVLKAAFGFASLFRSDVVVVESEAQLERAGRKAFAVWAALPGAGGFDLMVRPGDPATHALDAARAERADVLVFGYPRGEGIDGTSVAARIVRGAPCAVLAVPA